MKKILILSLVTISFLISGCAHEQRKVQYVYVSIPLKRPEKPVLPNVKGSDMACLSSDTKNILLERNKLLTNYTEKLEATIDATKLTSQIGRAHV